MFNFLRGTKPITRLTVDPPPARADRSGIILAATVHNEAAHLGEWLDFHRAVGVGAFVIYDDASTDDIAGVVAPRGDSHRVTVIPWAQRVRDAASGTRINNQVLAYAHAIRNFGAGCRWMGFIDIDEFLIPVRCCDLNAALADLDVPNISLPWHMFGRGGNATRPADGVLASYTRRAAHPMAQGARGVVNFKSLVDPARIARVKVHGMETDPSGATWNDAGARSDMRRRFSPTFLSTERIQLNHYYTRSNEDLSAKINGPGVGFGLRDPRVQGARVMDRVAFIESDTVEDRRAADLWAALRAKGVERVKGIEPSS